MLQLYNTLGRCKAPLQSLRAGRVGLYVCGVTVYDYCHLGHARVLVVFDLVVRCLRALGWQVHYVRNITDIDDKILQRAAETGEPHEALTERFINAMREDERALMLLAPEQEPRATAHIPQMIAMIETLLQKGHAYRSENGDVYYAVQSFADYGKLSGRRPEELLVGARVEPGEQKKDPRDFALWKAASTDEVGWDAPWGRGRPGWHIECSAMSTHCLGDSFDIHGGGPDLLFPHHENEIAQAEAATGKPFAGTWMHVGAVQLQERKMSKSEGNFLTVRELLQHWPAEVLRYFLLASHYRSPIEYTGEQLAAARNALNRFYQALQKAADVEAAEPDREEPHTRNFFAAIEDDFNVPEALAAMFAVARELNRCEDPGEVRRLAGILRGLGNVLGLLQQAPESFLQAGGTGDAGADEEEEQAIEDLIEERGRARQAGDWAEADRIRKNLEKRGILLEDRDGKTTWRRA